ncbi:hypothetical protein F2Q70_00035621 [Brassica cretica]|uniref:Uncharacterized protein n=1 Tax=Brassica cretica TaxID=69181 RepID=A0A8S9JRW0_BRACR|nr:hypothetical protein F2Q70_00035621 [Brassica cretica]
MIKWRCCPELVQVHGFRSVEVLLDTPPGSPKSCQGAKGGSVRVQISPSRPVSVFMIKPRVCPSRDQFSPVQSSRPLGFVQVLSDQPAAYRQRTLLTSGRSGGVLHVSWTFSQLCGARGATAHASGAMRSDTRATTNLKLIVQFYGFRSVEVLLDTPPGNPKNCPEARGGSVRVQISLSRPVSFFMVKPRLCPRQDQSTGFKGNQGGNRKSYGNRSNFNQNSLYQKPYNNCYINNRNIDDFWQVVKEEKLQEGDFEEESLMSFGGSHWSRSIPEHRSTYTNSNRSTGVLEHRSTTPTEPTVSCNAAKILTHKEFAAKHPHPPNPDNV